ncbi:MAG TPA: Rieske 2Fe-2S domain-containing protein [Polyangiaceae bacterium]
MVPEQQPGGTGGAQRVRVTGARALAAGASQVFAYERAGKLYEGFVLHHPSGFFAFANACPHWNVDLDLGFGEFYDRDEDRIFCRNHGALFLPTTGECTAGPCAGLFLEQFPVELEGQDAIVTIAPVVVINAGNLG